MVRFIGDHRNVHGVGVAAPAEAGIARSAATIKEVAQPAAIPNFDKTSSSSDLGVRMGHWHLNTADVEATKHMFVAMGGRAATVGQSEVVVFPDVMVHLHLDGGGPPPS